MFVVPAMTPTVEASLLDGIRALMSVMPVAGAAVFLLGAILFLCTIRRDRAEAVCRSQRRSGWMRRAEDVQGRQASVPGNPLSPQGPTADHGLLSSHVKGTVP